MCFTLPGLKSAYSIFCSCALFGRYFRSGKIEIAFDIMNERYGSISWRVSRGLCSSEHHTCQINLLILMRLCLYITCRDFFFFLEIKVHFELQKEVFLVPNSIWSFGVLCFSRIILFPVRCHLISGSPLYL